MTLPELNLINTMIGLKSFQFGLTESLCFINFKSEIAIVIAIIKYLNGHFQMKLILLKLCITQLLHLMKHFVYLKPLWKILLAVLFFQKIYKLINNIAFFKLRIMKQR